MVKWILMVQMICAMREKVWLARQSESQRNNATSVLMYSRWYEDIICLTSSRKEYSPWIFTLRGGVLRSRKSNPSVASESCTPRPARPESSRSLLPSLSLLLSLSPSLSLSPGRTRNRRAFQDCGR